MTAFSSYENQSENRTVRYNFTDKFPYILLKLEVDRVNWKPIKPMVYQVWSI